MMNKAFYKILSLKNLKFLKSIFNKNYDLAFSQKDLVLKNSFQYLQQEIWLK